jgi:hypothetical protein
MHRYCYFLLLSIGVQNDGKWNMLYYQMHKLAWSKDTVDLERYMIATHNATTWTEICADSDLTTQYQYSVVVILEVDEMHDRHWFVTEQHLGLGVLR